MMTTEQLQVETPAVFAEGPVHEVSKKYTFIPTTQLIADFEKLGWHVERARQQKSKKRFFTKHMLVLRSPQFPSINGFFPELIMVNSHDRTSSFSFQIGLFRLICSNGLVVADKIFESFRVRHIHYEFNDLEALTNIMVENMPKVIKWITRMQAATLTNEQQREFAVKAIAARFKEYVDDEGDINAEAIYNAIDVDEFLQAQREEDDNPSVWAVYNRVQEKLMKGGFYRVGTKDEKKKRTRGITNIKLDVDMNKSLWQLANEYLPN